MIKLKSNLIGYNVQLLLILTLDVDSSLTAGEIDNA